MSSARHHAEWLGLIEQSGPFLSLPVLLRVFPQGLETVAPEMRRRLAQAYAEWQASCEGGKPDPVLHQAWIRFVLDEVLELPEAALLRDQALPKSLQLNRSEEGEILRPDVALVAPYDDVPPASPAPGAARQPRLLIQTYAPGQRLDKTVPGRFWKASPAARMADLLRAADVPLGLVSNGEDWLLIHAPREVETASYATWHASLWSEEPLTLRAFASLLGVRRWFGVAPRGQLAALFAESAEHQEAVTAQLGAQVLAAVEILIQSIDRLDKERGRALLDGESVTRLYESGLTVMMRLVFLLFAEERDLLPADNPIYAQHYAVSTLGAQLRETADQLGEEILERRYDAWNRLLALFRLIFAGSESEDLRLPAYGGHLFDPDRFPFLEGRPSGSRWQRTRAEPLPIHNRTVLHLLEALQYLKLATPGGGPAQARRLSFRALTEENIGTVYEGLLDHTARRTQQAMLGLSAAKGSAVERPLTELEAQFTEGEQALVAALKQSTKRSASALGRALSEGQAASTDSTQADDLARLRTACDNDEALLARVRPFAKLLRADSQGYPFVITPGSVFVTAGQDRRSSGTHYTPPELTEPIVRHALDPLVYAGMAEGIAPSRETLRAPAEILALRVCDLACGSGAFLVQGCRYLADKLVAAWEQLESRQPGQVIISPEGALASERPVNCPIPSDPEARRMVARRLVADRCLYGVDINPLAVEMAKLSLWLVTLQRDKPFTFLDHALVAGDSLLGIAHLDELEAFYMDAGGQQRVSIHADNLRDAAKKRVELALIPDNSLDQIESKALLLQDAEEAVRQTRLLADLVTGAKLAAAGAKRKRADALLQTAALLDFGGMEQQVGDWLKGQHPLHWPLTFPEVFLPADSERAPGFDAFVGNPPFMGGKKITGNLSTDYRGFLVEYLAGGTKGNADLCAYFFLRAASLLKPEGMAGLLATNSIAQGDTREVGLDQLVGQGFSIPRAIPSRKWPGSANLEVAHVWLHRPPEGCEWEAGWLLNDQPVPGITPYLTETGAVVGQPRRLKANEGKSFQGSNVLGMGFVLDPDEAEALLAQDSKHRDCLFPYLIGDDLNSSPDQSPSRWVINFHDWPLDRSEEGSWKDADEEQRKQWLRSGYVPGDYPAQVAADYPILLEIIRERVKPEREKLRRKKDASARGYAKFWWRYARRAAKLYPSIVGLDHVLVFAQTSKTKYPAFVRSGMVYGHKSVVISLAGIDFFALFCSHIHVVWVLMAGSSLRTDPVYTPTDCFETFPFPDRLRCLADIGERYYNHRQQIMQARQEGLTKTYNRFHDPDETSADIAELRALHVEMDQAVAAAYGWTDLDLGHDFHDTKQGLRYTLSEPARREVLDRLLHLNHERYAQEVAQGLHDKARNKIELRLQRNSLPRKSDPSSSGQQNLF